jgi:predicted TIM-barrel fold metal-dependent hydrolase
MIDFHVHIGPSEKLSHHETLDSWSEKMIRLGVDSSVIMPNLATSEKVSLFNNQFMHQLLKKSYDHKFYPILISDGTKETMNDLEFYQESIHGIKIHPSILQKRINNGYFQNPLSFANSKKWICIVHSGRDVISRPGYVFDVSHKYPDVKFVIAHLGGVQADLIEKTIQFVVDEGIPWNVYFDMSGVKLPYIIEKAAFIFGSYRILYGSDAPYADERIMKYCFDLVDLPYKDSIAEGNARRLLCL